MLNWLLNGIVAIVVEAVNGLIAALAAALAALISILPDMPDLPDLPEAFDTALGWVAWFLPVHQILLSLEFVIAMWLLWQAVALLLRWAKALGDA